MTTLYTLTDGYYQVHYLPHFAVDNDDFAGSTAEAKFFILPFFCGRVYLFYLSGNH